MGENAKYDFTPGLEGQRQFADSLAGIAREDVFALRGLSSYISHNGKFHQLELNQTGIHLGDEYYSIVQPSREAQFSFVAQPGNRLGREDSHNKVFFGQSVIELDGTRAMELQVAVKPRGSNIRLTNVTEFAMHQYLNELEVPTLQPVAVLATETSDFLVTRFNNGVVTLDSIDWHALDIEEKWQQVSTVVDTMALLHSHALFHGDLEFRNVAIDDAGEAVIVDPELMVSVRERMERAKHDLNSGDMRSPDLLAIANMISAEFVDACKSIDEFIITSMPRRERPRTDEAKFKLYKKHLFDKYQDAIRTQGGEYTDVLRAAYGLVLEQKKSAISR